MKKAASIALSVLFALLLAYKWKDLPGGALWQALRQVQPLYLVAGMVLLVGGVLLQALRWQRLMPGSWGVSLWQAFEAAYIGVWFNLLPGRVGDVVRPYFLAQKKKVPFGAVVGTTVWDRLLDTLVVLPLVLYTAGLPGLRQVAPGLWGTALGFAGVLCAMLLVVFFKPTVQRYIFFLPQHWQAALLRLQAEFYNGLRFAYSGRVWWRALPLSVASWGLNVLGYGLLLGGFALPAPLHTAQAAVVVTVASAFAHVVPAAGAGLGVLNYVVVVCLTGLLLMHHIPPLPHEALMAAAGLLLYVAVVLPDILIGGCFYWANRHTLLQPLPVGTAPEK